MGNLEKFKLHEDELKEVRKKQAEARMKMTTKEMARHFNTRNMQYSSVAVREKYDGEEK